MRRRKSTSLLAMLTMCLIMATIIVSGYQIPNAHAAADLILFVEDDATGTGDGSSWVNAFTDLQDALDEAEVVIEGPDVSTVEIWVAAGTYKPSYNYDLDTGTDPDPRLVHFRMANNVAIYGGFAGDENPSVFNLAHRDFTSNETILSGDIGDEYQNSYHVFYHPADWILDETAILDGFTIIAGFANLSTGHQSEGGGMYNYGTLATPHTQFIGNIIFSDNSAQKDGGGMYNYNSNPTLTAVSFEDNRSNTTYGGGMYNFQSLPTLTDVRFERNSASRGGGMYSIMSTPTLTSVDFNTNSAAWGGGMFNALSSPTLNDVTFTANSASENGGGGIVNYEESAPILNDVTFLNNTAVNGHGGGVYNSLISNAVFTNVRFEGNTASHGGGMYNSSSDPILTTVTFQGNIVNFADGDAYGGGMYNVDSNPSLELVDFISNGSDIGGGIANLASSPTLNDVYFSLNNADVGGGMANESDDSGNRSNPTLNNVAFEGNTAFYGGGMGNKESDPTLFNVLFSGNSAEYDGGGMHNYSSFPTLTNVTFSGNLAEADGGGIKNYWNSDPIITNCILYGNAVTVGTTDNEQINNEIGNPHANDSIPVISNSLIQDSRDSDLDDWNSDLGTDAGGNIDADPNFLLNPAIGGVGSNYGDLRLSTGSPAIDAGNNDPITENGITLDIGGNTRIVNNQVDMGAFETQPPAPPPPPPPPPPSPAPAGPETERLGGTNRFETAVAISQEGWQYAEVVILTRSDEYADALTGAPLAYLNDAPILLTNSSSLHPITKAEIQRLGASKVIVLGGTNAISAAVVLELEDMGITTERIAGSNRFETAAAIAAKVAPNGAAEIVLAYGHNFPDALSVAPYAANRGIPILLTNKDSVPQETVQAIADLNVGNVIAVGGSSVISEESLVELGTFRRIAGSNRFETAIALANHFVPDDNIVFIATGMNYADALTGAVLAAREGYGLLLVDNTVPDAVANYLAARSVHRFIILGGTSVISDALVTQLVK